jgi:hemerythrin-like domain-containing protein
MLRDKNLIPLSRQHQHVLALCVRIDRASPVGDADLAAWQAEIAQLCQSEIRIHFAAEENLLFPAALRFTELTALVESLLADHAALRDCFARAEGGAMSASDVLEFAQRMSAHIRNEERNLFERMQQLLTQEELAQMGSQLDSALKAAEQVCLVPNEATRLRTAP